MGVTILDVAKKAGVSSSTVSLVINNSDRVRPGTRDSIQKIIKELGYIPNRGARSIVTSRTSNIGLLVILEDNKSEEPYSVENVINSFSTDISAGVEEEIQPTHYGLIYARSNGKSARDLPKIVDSSYIDGLIIAGGGTYTREFLKAIEKTGIPTVVTGSNYVTKRISSIFCDPYGAMKEIINYLISMGRKSIGFINTSSASYNTEPKLRGYRDALEESNIPFDDRYIISAGFSAMDGRRATRELLSRPMHFDAIACALDGLAIGALYELQSRKIAVPQKVALTGFGDSWIASHSIPSLTTVRIPKFDIGKLLLNSLLDILKGKMNPGFKILVDSEIIIREST